MNILVLETSLSGKQSATRAMTAAYLADIVSAHPGGHVQKHDFALNPIPYLPPELVPVQFGADPCEHTAAVAIAETLINQLEVADLVIIGAPMYNFMIPATLKTWFDYVVRAQRTFSFDGEAPRGLLQPGKKVVVMIASGGVYSQGSAQNMNFAEPYLRAVLGFIGLIDVSVVWAEAQATPSGGFLARENAIEQVHLLAAA